MGAILYLNDRVSRGSITGNAAIIGAPYENMTIDVAISGAPHGSMPVDAAIGGAPHESIPICIANGCDHRRISPVFNKVELRYSFLASAELAEGAVTARFFLVGLYEGNAWVKEFAKHMAHSDLEVG